eukprot:GHVU01224101.1.p1 GENE.GHVU01224101.1~~GHVU01224101.1.p1  ORF type:complete len:441 (+),score=41.80 GHVU01224101.1:495-1817(+)
MQDESESIIGDLDVDVDMDDRFLSFDDSFDDEQVTPTAASPPWQHRRRILLLAALAVLLLQFYEAAQQVVRPRLSWELHTQLLMRECGGAFARYYRMSLDAFRLLTTIVDPFLQRDDVMAWVSCGTVAMNSTLILHCTLRWLGGGEYDDLRIIAGISKASFYRALHAGLLAICLAPELAYRFPDTVDEVDAAAAAFSRLSRYRIILGCVGAMDCLLLRIRAPSRRETGHVRSYYSGHYRCYGISILGVCDHLCRFVHVSVAQPGGSNDITTFRRSAVRNHIQRLPLGRFVVGDNGFICTERVITPFYGRQGRVALLDTFNYQLSQLRIRIEMAFGFLTTKWGRMQKRLQLRLRNVGLFVMAVTRLHNYVITSRQRAPDSTEISPLIYQHLRYREGYLPTAGAGTRDRGSALLRQEMVDEIDRQGLRRPQHNLERRAAERE